jgi:antitoxin component YwqK of YwqJK toxin-antitoxin module
MLLFRFILLIFILAAAFVFIPLRKIMAQPSVFIQVTDSTLLNPDEDFSLRRESPVTIDLEKEMEEEEDKKEIKKKVKRKVFFGYKTKKGFTKTGYGNNLTIELFHVLKEYQQPDPYVPEITWYEFRRKQIRSTGEPTPKTGNILHGPYKRIVGEQVVEEGMYYIGTKHGRWMSYDRNDVLVNKEYYHKGWPKESLVRYYDDQFTRLKEVIPRKYGKMEGTYFYFHENGEVAVKGEYRNNSKVGAWTEYYPFRNRRKKEVQYPGDPYDSQTAPYISKEWDRRGTAVYEYK